MSKLKTPQEVFNYCSDWTAEDIISILLDYIGNQQDDAALMDHLYHAADEDGYSLPGMHKPILYILSKESEVDARLWYCSEACQKTATADLAKLGYTVNSSHDVPDEPGLACDTCGDDL